MSGVRGLNRIAMNLARYLLPGGSVSFWHTPLGPVSYAFDSLSDYYIDFAAKTRYRGPLDREGIPILDYRGVIGKQYNPCATAQYALGWFQSWRRHDDRAARGRFVACADWLLREGEPGGDALWWRYRFDLDAYGLRNPWVSALAQAQALSVLLRAHAETSDAAYWQAAVGALRSLMVPVEAGGVLRKTNDGVVLEEVVADRPVAILDGWIFAMFGLFDAHYAGLAAAVNGADALLERSVATLERWLPSYDLGYWSRADLYAQDPVMPASRFYHRLHVAQLRIMHELTGRECFEHYARQWANNDADFASRARALSKKVYFKLRHY